VRGHWRDQWSGLLVWLASGVLGLVGVAVGVTCQPAPSLPARHEPAPPVTEPSAVTAAPPEPPRASAAPPAASVESGSEPTDLILPAGCHEALEVMGAPQPRERCDATFQPSPRGIHCSPDDLMCNIRSVGLRRSALYHPPPAAEQADCSSECSAGNGASCYRLAQRLARPRGQLDANEAKACRNHFALRACRLGLPQGCAHAERPSDTDPTLEREAAFARLEKRCDPAVASWACFYVAHNTAMAWGTGLGSQKAVKRLYQRVCKARCPPSPMRCYRELACQRYEEECRH